MKRTQVKALLCIFFCLFPLAIAGGNSFEVTDEHRGVKRKFDDSGEIKDRFTAPLTTDKKMSTMDGSTEFEANFRCSGEAPVIEVTALPSGSLGGTGELDITIRYDTDLDGTLDATVQAGRVAGMCGNGIIKGCTPGTWEGCDICDWDYADDGSIYPQCELVSDGGTVVKNTILNMKGCFCFSRACGNPVTNPKVQKQILYFAGEGIADLIKEKQSDFAIASKKFFPSQMKAVFYGYSLNNCVDNSSNQKIKELQNLKGKYDFPTEAEENNAGEDSPYSTMKKSFTENNDQFQYKHCEIKNTVKTEVEEVRRYVPTKIIIGYDKDGGTKDCYWTHIDGSHCSSSMYVGAGLHGCIDKVVDNKLANACNQLHQGYLKSIEGVDNPHAISGFHDFASCYGSDNDAGDQKWAFDCYGPKDDDIFTCHSSSMGVDGEVFYNGYNNLRYEESMYQGCNKVYPTENYCTALAEDEDCELIEERTDGIVTIKGGALTGVEPIGSCKTVSGNFKNLTVCEPWWKKERVYKCESDVDTDLSNVRERTDHIQANQEYDPDTKTWQSQSDLQFANSTSPGEVSVFDPALAFQDEVQECSPACLVQWTGKNTNIVLNQQQKNDDNAGDPDYEQMSGESSVVNANKEYVEKRFCEQNNAGQYECPVDASAGESVASPCSCGDDSQFAQVATQLSIFRDLPDDVVCSSGNEVGMCSAAETAPRMVCIPDAKFSGDGMDFSESDQGGVVDCEPDAWLASTPLSNQDHYVEATDEYECWAGIEGYSETPGDTTDQDFFANNLGKLAPASSWFDPVVAWAKPEIERRLASDPDFIPDPGPDCPCEGSDSNSTSTPDEEGIGTYDCEWTVATSVDNINRLDSLALQPEQDDLFGKAVLSFSATGSWGGSHSAECQEIDNFEYEPIKEYEECKHFDNQAVFSIHDEYHYGRFEHSKWGNLWYFSDNLADTGLQAPITCTSKMWYRSTYGDRQANGQIRIYHNGSEIQRKTGRRVRTRWRSISTSTTINSSSGTIAVRFRGWTTKSNQHTQFKINAGGTPSALVCTGKTGKEMVIYDSKYNNTSSLRISNSWKTIKSTIDVPKIKDGKRYNISGGVELKNAESGEMTNSVEMYAKLLVNGNVYATSSRMISVNVRNWDYLFWGFQNVPISALPNKRATVKIYVRARTSDDYYVRITDSTSVKYYHNSQTAKSGWWCPVNSQIYDKENTCDSDCYRNTGNFRCIKTGETVSDPSFCKGYYCPLTDTYYTSNDNCLDACINDISCNSQSENYEFEVAIQNDGSNDYLQKLRQTKPKDRSLNSAKYRHEDLILRQCVNRYKNPVTSFDDSQNFHFEFSPIDHLVYNYSADYKSELPFSNDHGTLILPEQPPVYTGGSESVPRRPMFPDLDLSLSWSDDDATRLGRYSLGVGNIKPLAYYYECPQGRIEPGYNCNADPDPFGGTDWTVKGNYCFQHRCSESQLDDPEHTYSGCGYVNDGSWE